MDIASFLVTALFAVLVLGGSFYLLVAVIAMWRAKDALSRVNKLSSGVMVGIPALVLANMVVEADQGVLTWGKALTGIIAIASVLVVATVASEVLGRAVLGARDGSAEDYKPHTAHKPRKVKPCKADKASAVEPDSAGTSNKDGHGTI